MTKQATLMAWILPMGLWACLPPAIRLIFLYRKIGSRKMTPFKNAAVAAVFEVCPTTVRGHLFTLREQIFDVAATTHSFDTLHETLKWGQPSYAEDKKVGTALRLNVLKSGGFTRCVHRRPR